MYLGGAVVGDGKTEREVGRRIQAGTNARRAVEGVMAARRISKRLKGKVMSTCVTPTCLYGMETLALTKLQQQRLQVCENNWVRRIATVTRADRRRMVELREEMGVQRSLTERLVRSRLQWAGPRGIRNRVLTIQRDGSYVYAVVSLAAGGHFVGGHIVTCIFSRVSVGSACVRVWKRDCDVTSVVEHRVKGLQQNGP